MPCLSILRGYSRLSSQGFLLTMLKEPCWIKPRASHMQGSALPLNHAQVLSFLLIEFWSLFFVWGGYTWSWFSVCLEVFRGQCVTSDWTLGSCLQHIDSLLSPPITSTISLNLTSLLHSFLIIYRGADWTVLCVCMCAQVHVCVCAFAEELASTLVPGLKVAISRGVG